MELTATVLWRQDLSRDLFVLRVKPDAPLFEFKPGQYAVLGLPASNPRDGTDREALPSDKLIRRPYSIASSPHVREHVEFYIKRVDEGPLTPRLYKLRPGDRIWMGPKAAGHFTLDSVPPGKSLIMVATGTGVAPYVSMVRSDHRCNVSVVHGARYVEDLGYREELEELDRTCGPFRYIPTLTRPPAGWTGHVGRVQTVFEDGTLAAQPDRDHVFLCGGPEMVDAMQAFFEARGFTLHRLHAPGNIHVERYW